MRALLEPGGEPVVAVVADESDDAYGFVAVGVSRFALALGEAEGAGTSFLHPDATHRWPATSAARPSSLTHVDALRCSIYAPSPVILDRSSVGQAAAPTTFSYDWKALATYALGIGAKKDELDYLYERRGPKVYPTFAVVPAFPAMMAAIELTKGDFTTVVHGSQSVRAHKAIAAEGTLTSTGRVVGVFDMKKLGNVQLLVETRDEAGDLVYETDWNILFRGPVAPGAPPPPKHEAPSVPRERPYDARMVEATSPEQALLYRLSGDPNPLHADPVFAAEVGFPQGAILHGLCTYGHAARAVVKSLLGGDASRLKRFDCQFRKPVWPGDTLITDMWKLDDGRISVSTLVEGKPDPVLTQCWAVVD